MDEIKTLQAEIAALEKEAKDFEEQISQIGRTMRLKKKQATEKTAKLAKVLSAHFANESKKK